MTAGKALRWALGVGLLICTGAVVASLQPLGPRPDACVDTPQAAALNRGETTASSIEAPNRAVPEQPGTATQPLASSPVTVVDQGKGQPQSPTVTAPDPEQELVNGNVDLAHSALELALKQASGAPGVADSEKAYRQASDRQAARLEKAGYPSETWNGQSADANWQ